MATFQLAVGARLAATALDDRGALSPSFIAGRCKPKGCFRRPGIAAITIVQQQIGCLRRLGIHLSVSRCPHHEVKRLGHPRIARLRIGPGDNNGAEIGRGSGKLAQACDLAARTLAILRRQEGRRSKLQGKGAIVAKRDVVRGVGHGLIIGVPTLPPARCTSPITSQAPRRAACWAAAGRRARPAPSAAAA